jgi:hypothetical protein
VLNKLLGVTSRQGDQIAETTGDLVNKVDPAKVLAEIFPQRDPEIQDWPEVGSHEELLRSPEPPAISPAPDQAAARPVRGTGDIDPEDAPTQRFTAEEWDQLVNKARERAGTSTPSTGAGSPPSGRNGKVFTEIPEGTSTDQKWFKLREQSPDDIPTDVPGSSSVSQLDEVPPLAAPRQRTPKIESPIPDTNQAEILARGPLRREYIIEKPPQPQSGGVIGIEGIRPGDAPQINEVVAGPTLVPAESQMDAPDLPDAWGPNDHVIRIGGPEPPLTAKQEAMVQVRGPQTRGGQRRPEVIGMEGSSPVDAAQPNEVLGGPKVFVDRPEGSQGGAERFFKHRDDPHAIAEPPAGPALVPAEQNVPDLAGVPSPNDRGRRVGATPGSSCAKTHPTGPNASAGKNRTAVT